VVLLTLGISLIEALIILPAHVAHSKALSKETKTYWLNKIADQFMAWMRDKLYAPVLKFFLNNKVFGFAIPIAMLIMTIGALGGGIIRTTFFPRIASDRVSINLRMPQGTNEEITDAIISRVEEAAWQTNEEFTAKQTGNLQVVQNIIKRIGPGTANASLSINLLPGEDRDFPSTAVANSIAEKVGPVHEAEALEFGSGSNFGGKPVSISLISNNISELKAAKEELKTLFKNNPVLKDISDNDPAGIKEIKVKLKDNAYLLGLNLSSVMSQVRGGFFGKQAQRFQRGRDEIRVWVRFDKSDRESIKNLDDMWVSTPSGGRVPFSEIATYQIERGEVAINHLNGAREIKVEANLKDREESATDVLTSIQENEMSIIFAKYPNVSALYEGQNREAAKVADSARGVIPVVLFLMYGIIAFTFRSYSQPLLLFVMVPFSLITVAWGHWIHGFQVNILSSLGIIALIGIMVNDGLVLIGKFNLYLKEGMKFDDALFRAGMSRFRPIFLTSITTIAGLAPLIFETSRQAQFLIPMAISIAYGIMLATFLTLLKLPLLLSLNNDIKVFFRWLTTGVKPSKEEVERAVKEQKVETDELH